MSATNEMPLRFEMVAQGNLFLELAVLVGTVADQSIKVRAGFHEQERVALCAVALTSD
jgi:hypothetical protein